MKKSLLCLLGLASLGLWAETRTVSFELSAATKGLFAVPNGCSFVRATATDARGVSVPVTVGDPTTMNNVSLVSVVPAAAATVTVTFEDGAPRFTGSPSKVLRERIRAMVVNPEDVPLVQETTARRSLAAAPVEHVDYLILAPHDYVALWEKFKTARATAHPEVAFAVKDLAEVYAEFPIGSDGVRNYAESIHKYLRSVRDTMGLSYVVLGGMWIDAQSLNENGEWVRNEHVVTTLEGVPVSIANAVPGLITFPRKEAEEIPSDMFYACLDLKPGQTYPWAKGEATRYYESFQNEADRKEYDSGVDIVVSRMPLKPIQFTIPEGAQILPEYAETMHVGDEHLFTPAELMDYLIAKQRRAESASFAGMGRLGLSWGDFNYTKRDLDASLKTENEFFDDIPNFFAQDRQTDQYGNLEMRHRDRLKDIVAPNYPLLTVDARCEHGTTWTKGLATVQDAQAQFLRTDHDFNVVAMHGWAGGSAWYHVEDTYNQTGIILFNDMSFPCETGWPDFVDGKTYVSKVCCGEATVLAPFGGAIASVNNTRSGWAGGVGQLSDQHNVNGYRGFTQHGYNAGETWLAAHLDFAGISPDAEGFQTSNTGGTGAWVLSEHILYGDPLIRTRALVDTTAPLSALPTYARNVTLAGAVTVSGTNGVVHATAAGDVSFAPAAGTADSAAARMKILDTLSVGGTSATFGAGLEGGVGRTVAFTGAPGTVTLETTGRFYLGGVSNATRIVVRGTHAIIDCDNLKSVSEIVFETSAGATNVLRGIKTGALAGVAVRATGGTILCESSNLFGGTTVNLEGTTVALGSDPSVGKLVASGEPFDATFTGSGIIEYNHGTELLKQWTIAGNIQLKEVGALVVGFAYSGQVGANPTGWFTSWRGENLSDAHAVLGPNGTFVRLVEEGDHHPYYALPSKKGFTLALYADLSKVTNDKAVMMSLGHSGNVNQLLLMKSGGKIRVEVAGNLGGAAPDGCWVETDYPGPGYHLYLLEKTETGVTLYVDSPYASVSVEKAFTMGVGFQVGSQYGGLKAGRTRAYGMAVAEVRGYDAILTEDEHRALFKEFPAKAFPLAIDTNVELNKAETEAQLVNATFGKTAYLGGSNGILTIPEGVTVDTYGVKLNNTSRSADDVTLNVYGTLNVLGTTTSAGVYTDLRNTTQIAGIMLGHYAGTSALNVYGRVDAQKADLLIGYTCAGRFTIDGGLVKLHGLTNQAGGIRNDKGSVAILNGGVLELAAWPVRNLATPGTMPIEIADGTIRATGDWTCPWPLTVTDGATIDLNGHHLVFSGAIAGAGRLTVVDSSNGQGSVSFLGDMSEYFGAMTVAASVKRFGIAAGFEGKVGFTARPEEVTLHLTAEQMTAGYTSTAWAEMGVANAQAGAAAATVIFADMSGNELQSMTGAAAAIYAPSTWTTAMPYNYDGRDWSYVFIPQKGDHEWSTLANWRAFETNDAGVVRSVPLFTSGDAPNTTSGCGRWDAAILDAALFPEGEPEDGELVEVHASRIEGWLAKIGVYNGTHLTVDEFFKFQKGGAAGNAQWIVVDGKSRLTIKRVGTGNSDSPIPLYVAAEDGLVIESDVAGNGYHYYFSGNGSVRYPAGITRGTHVIKSAEMPLSAKSNRFLTRYLKLVDFGEHDGAPAFTVASDADIRMRYPDGTEELPRKMGSPADVLDPTSADDIGKYALMQDKYGLYLCYVDYDDVETVKTITGAKTNLDLNDLKDQYTERFIITGASGYFKKQIVTVDLPVEFRDTANGGAAWDWDNGYSDSSAACFARATGSGTITATGRATSQMIVFGIDSTFNGSIDLTGGRNRVVFGETPTSLASAANSSITVEPRHAARIKRDGVWRADYITINGPVAIDGKATIDAKLGLTLGSTGAINAEASVGSVYYELFRDAVVEAADAQPIRLYRNVWGHRLDKGETIRIIKNNKEFTVESFFPVTTTEEDGVTTYTAHEVARADAVAEINGVYYDTWDHALGAQRENGYSIIVLKDDALPAGYMVVDGKLVKAQAQVGATLYQTFAQARAANGAEAVITLLDDAAYELVFAQRDDSVRVKLNGFRFLREPRVFDTYLFALVVETDAATGVTTYAVREVEHAHNAYIDRVVEGLSIRYWYNSVEEAFAFATTGETIRLNTDLVLNTTLELVPGVKIDFNGHKLIAEDPDVTIDDTYYTVIRNADDSFTLVNDTYVWTGTEWTHDGETVAGPGATDRAVFPSALGAAEFAGDLTVKTLTVKATSLTLADGTVTLQEGNGAGTIVLGANAGLVGTAKIANNVQMTDPTAFLAGELDFGKRTLELATGEIRGKVRADVRKVGGGTLTVSAVQRGETEPTVNYDIVAGTLALAVDPGVNLSYKGTGATIRLLDDIDISPYAINSTSAIVVDTAADVTFAYDFESYGQNNAKHELVKLGDFKLTMAETPWTSIDKVDVKEGTLDIATPWLLKTGQRFNVYPGTLVSGTGSILLGRDDFLSAPAELHMLPGGKGTIAEVSANIAGHEAALSLWGGLTLWQGTGYVDVHEGLTLRVSGHYDTDTMTGEKNYQYKRLRKRGLGTLELMRTYYLYTQLTIEEGGCIFHSGAYTLGGKPTLNDGVDYQFVASDPTEQVTIRAAQVPGTTVTMSVNGVTAQTDEVSVLWGTKVEVTYAAKRGYVLEGPATYVVPRAVADETVGADLMTSMYLVDATYSLNMDGNCTTKSEILGGAALPRTGDDFFEYIAVRGSATNKGAVPGGGKNGPYCDGSMIADTNAWSILTVAELSETEKGVLWSVGKVNVAPKTGLALIEKDAGRTVQLVRWGNGVDPVAILAYTHADDTLVKGQHVYLVTFDGTSHALYLDGRLVATTKTAYTYAMAGYQLGGVHGGSGSARLAVGSGVVIDEFGVWSGMALDAALAEEVAAKYPTLTWATVPLAAEMGEPDRTKLEAWATRNGLVVEEALTIKPLAYVFNCANTEAAIAAEQREFKLTIEMRADGTAKVSLPEGKAYNVEPTIQGRPSLETGAWHDRQDGDHFFRAVIK